MQNSPRLHSVILTSSCVLFVINDNTIVNFFFSAELFTEGYLY